MAIDWDTIYKQKWQELSGGYKKREDSLNAAKAAEIAQLSEMLSQNKEYLADQRDESMRQAYVSKMNAVRELPETLKKSGSSGGMTESAAADILRSYQNSRNSANGIFADGISQLNAEFGKNKSSVDTKYLTLFNELEDAKNKDVWDQTKFAYNAALEEQKAREAQAAALEEKRRWEEEQALAQAKQQELIRQFNEQMAFKQQQAEWERQQAESDRQQSIAAAASKSSGGSSRSKKSSSKNSGSKKAASVSSASRFNVSGFFDKAKKLGLF